VTDARSSFCAALCRFCECGARDTSVQDWDYDQQHAQYHANRRKHQISRFRYWLHLFRERVWGDQQRGTDSASGYNPERDDGGRAIAMAGATAQQQAYLSAANPRRSISADRALQRARIADGDHRAAHNFDRNRHGLHLGVWALALLPMPAWGQVNATAAPSSVSNGSVTNMAVQTMGGPFPTYHLGPNQHSCMGPQLSISPFVTKSHSYTLPRTQYQRTPFYNPLDADEDNVPDKPGEIMFYQETPTGQKDSHALNYGISATISIPLDGGLTARCKALGDTQQKLLEQVLAHKKLDYELGRLKFCGQQAKEGVIFRPGSQAAQICADVMVIPKPGQVLPHKHEVNAPEPDEEPLPLDSYLFAPDIVHEQKDGEAYALATP